MADDENNGCPGSKKDMLELGPNIGEGYHPYVRHRPNCSLETGLLKARKPGSDEAVPPCDGLVHLKHVGPGNVYDVETLYERPQQASEGRDGPAMVASDAYRDGWDRIFGAKTTVGQA